MLVAEVGGLVAPDRADPVNKSVTVAPYAHTPQTLPRAHGISRSISLQSSQKPDWTDGTAEWMMPKWANQEGFDISEMPAEAAPSPLCNLVYLYEIPSIPSSPDLNLYPIHKIVPVTRPPTFGTTIKDGSSPLKHVSLP